MKLRTAKKGKNVGGQFWGCSEFPKCWGTRDIESVATNEEEVPQPLPVAWIEGVRRLEFIPEYLSVGAMPGAVRHKLGEDSTLEKVLTQCVLLSRRGRTRNDATEHSRTASVLLAKILQRGRTPLPSLGLEKEALRKHGLLEDARDLSGDEVELGWALSESGTATVNADALVAVLGARSKFSLDPDFRDTSSSESLLQSPEETWFLDEWVPNTLGESAAHWFTPQAPLDVLLESGGIEESGARRIDFLFCHPGSPPIGIEIDGEEHESATAVDRARDQSLARIGIDVLRVTHQEIRTGAGVAFDRLISRCKSALSHSESTEQHRKIANFLLDCSNAAKIQFAIVRAIGWGWLTADQDWNIELAGAGTAAAAGILDVLKLLSSLDLLYGGTSVPTTCVVRGDNGLHVGWRAIDDGTWEEISPFDSDGECVRIVVESNTSPYHRLDSAPNSDFIIRPAFLSVDFASDQPINSGRRSIEPSTYEQALPALTNFLHTVFRKIKFRQRQGEAIYNALRQQDCVVLLPTGAGKSLIYQLAGLLMPGVTIVVDPIVSLIEDQVEGLRAYGIDRVAPIARALNSPEERKNLLKRVERGEYHFVLLSPERIQSPQFRSTLRALTSLSLVNLAVIDEAHCVSEWGHSFRTAYLHLGKNLRRFCEDQAGAPPPVLALTGTASRAVLRDMLIDLEIDRNRSDSLIRPESFDRPELHFEVVRTSPSDDPSASLRGVLNSLPAKFGLPRAELFQPSGRHTASGIVFVPTINARVYGVIDTHKTVRNATEAPVEIYTGDSPKGKNSNTWDQEKRKNAQAFKQNQVPILVATKAFGMGIDKPNVRYTIHFGMPGSLESFYQEAGRAGRDGDSARCVVVFSEYDPVRSDTLLDPELAQPKLRELFNVENRNRKNGDDITQALWFHLEAFDGVANEINDVERLLNEIGSLSSRNTVEIPFDSNNGENWQEKALIRLLRIGVISDYEVDFGAKTFKVATEPFEIEHCKIRLLDYISAAQPAKSKIIARQLDEIDSGNPKNGAYVLSCVLIAFIYDVIERSRRRMIQESVLLARSAYSDADVRARLLDYLQEGLGAEKITQLLDQPEISLESWYQLVDKCQTPMDAGELRGLCIRALETYPDHPGLLLCRAVAEAMCSDHDESVSVQGIAAAIRASIVDYELEQEDIDSTIDSLLDLALTRARELGVSLIIAVLGLDESNAEFKPSHRRILIRAKQFDDERVRIAVASHRLRGIVHSLEHSMSRLNRQYQRPRVITFLRTEA